MSEGESSSSGSITGHAPVMLAEALEGLNIRPDGCYVDGTFGRGGHSQAILQRLGPAGRLLALDRDPEAVAWARQQIRDPRFTIVHGNFAELARWVTEQGWAGEVDGILLDVGVSSPQLDDPARVFSFMRPGPLDMRMDTTCGVTAEAWLRQVSETTLRQVLRDYGEERFAGRIARAIKLAADSGVLTTTDALARVVSEVVPRRARHRHPATRTFQAIRIAVNGELDALKAALQGSGQVLKEGGRLVVISFHSLEDRLVKRFIRAFSGQQAGRQGKVQPFCLKSVGKARFPSEREVERNPRARSAVMRIAEKRACGGVPGEKWINNTRDKSGT